MNFFPIVIRELLVAARSASTYRTRFWTPVAGLVITSVVVFAMGGRAVPGATQGPVLFTSLAVLGLAYSLFTGVRATADCLSFEKRDGTLGLLFLTDLRGIDVVLGKLSATSLSSIYGLVALVPILAIPLQMGGVTGMLFFQVVLCLLNALFLSLAVGMLVSALSIHDRKAMTAAALTIGSLALGPFALLVYAETLDGPLPEFLRFVVWSLLVLSPISSFLIANSTTVMGISISQFFLQWGWSQEMVFSVALFVSHGIAWGFLITAARVLVSFVRHEAQSSLLVTIQAWTHRIVYGSDEVRRAHRKKYLDLNAFSWLSSREQLKSKYVWIFVVSIVAIYAWNLRSQGDVMFDDRTLIPLGFLIHAFVKIWIASEACYRIAEDRRVGALELLLSTPLGPWDIVKGQLLALRRQFSGALLCLFGLELVLIFGFATEAKEGLGFQTRAIYLGGALMLLIDGAMITWVAMWNGVRYGGTNRAIVKTIGGFLVVPWVLYAIVVQVWNAARSVISNNGSVIVDLRWTGFESWYLNYYWEQLDTAGKVMLWVLVGVLFNLRTSLFGARFRLLKEFRESVSGFQRSSDDPKRG